MDGYALLEYNTEQALAKLKELREKWKHPTFGHDNLASNTILNSSQLLPWVLKQFELDKPLETVHLADIEIKYREELSSIIFLRLVFLMKNLLDTQDYFYQFNSVLETIHHCYSFVVYSIRTYNSVFDNTDTVTNENEFFTKYSTVPLSIEGSPYQKLLIYILNMLCEKKYKKYNDICYTPTYTVYGNYTYYWKPVVSIDEFLYKCIKKEVNYEQWKLFTSSSGMDKKITEYLIKCKDEEFPTLERSRHMFSFRNGIYITSLDAIGIDHKMEPIVKDSNILNDEYDPNDVIDYFYPYGNQNRIQTSYSSSAYFDCDFPIEMINVTNWKDISTPSFDSILSFQFEDEPDYEMICQWMYIFIGRMLYDLNQYDFWQIIPFLKGQAKTGKSTITTKVVGAIYEEADIATLSNDLEKTFGVSALLNKFIYIAPEIKGNFGLAQATFQSMISGENVNIPVKYQTALNTVWITPGFMSGNETPHFHDNAGSMSRRLAVFEFNNKISAKLIDTSLDKKLKKELPLILKKCNLAYLEMIKQNGSADIWKLLPYYFVETSRKISQQTNSLQAFVFSGKFVFGKSYYIPESVFKKCFKEFCIENGLPKHRYNEDYYRGPFNDVSERIGDKVFRVKPVKRQKKLWPYKNNENIYITGTFILGLGYFSPGDDESLTIDDLEMDDMNDYLNGLKTK